MARDRYARHCLHHQANLLKFLVPARLRERPLFPGFAGCHHHWIAVSGRRLAPTGAALPPKSPAQKFLFREAADAIAKRAGSHRTETSLIPVLTPASMATVSARCSHAGETAVRWTPSGSKFPLSAT